MAWVAGLALVSAWAPAVAQGLAGFGTVTLEPRFELDGRGGNVDSIASWEASDTEATLMFVTGKANDVVEVWRFPFQDQELPSIEFAANVNGVAIDQVADRLYVSDRVVSVFSLPGLQPEGEFGAGVIGEGENNLDLLRHAGGQTLVYVSDDHEVHRFDAQTRAYLGSFAPSVSSIETVLADDFYQTIHVPEEQGPEGNQGVYVYHPDGSPFGGAGETVYGASGIFDSDEEGIALYTFPQIGEGDDGTGFIVVADQREDVTEFEFFHRQTWAHLGTLRLAGVSNTDGIASTQRYLPGFPLGVFAAIDDDSRTALIGWDDVFEGLGWDLQPEVVHIAPVPGVEPGVGDRVEFEVVFSEPVTGFEDAGDVIIAHGGTGSPAVRIDGAGVSYSVVVSGPGLSGAVTLAVEREGGVQDASGNALGAGVTSAPVPVGSPYQRWASAEGLVEEPGAGGGMADDPDGDGDSNLWEFAFATKPLSGAMQRNQRVVLGPEVEPRFVAFTFPARAGAVFAGSGPVTATADGLVYSLAATPDLTASGGSLGLEELAPASAEELPALDEGWAYHTFRLTDAVGQRRSAFLHLSVAAAGDG